MVSSRSINRNRARRYQAFLSARKDAEAALRAADWRVALVRAFRWCWRCQRMRSVGNFTHSIGRGRQYAGKTCRRCVRRGLPRGVKIDQRDRWVITDVGRALLAADRARAGRARKPRDAARLSVNTTAC